MAAVMDHISAAISVTAPNRNEDKPHAACKACWEKAVVFVFNKPKCGGKQITGTSV